VARLLRLASIVERGLTGAARRLVSGRALIEPAELRPAAAAKVTGSGTSLAGPPVVLLAAVPWSYRFQRPQQLARAIAESGQPVLFVQAFTRSMMQPRLFARPQALGPLVLDLRIAGRPDPYRRVMEPAVARDAADLIVRGVKRPPACVIAELPFWSPLAQALQSRWRAPLVYDRLDLHAGFLGVPPLTTAAEQELIRAADLVAASAEALMPASARRAILVRNAVALSDFAPTNEPPSGRRRIGYVGALADWFDAEAVRSAAQALPDWLFALAGRVESTAVAALKALPNVRLLGEIPYSDVARFLASLHALVIPFADAPLTRAVDPVKLYEAMAVGVPVVARSLPEIERWPPPLVTTYAAASHLAGALVSAVAEDGPQRRAARRAAVAEETWAHRARQLLDALAISPTTS
jgi:glycosyltransferase involved in cell wall biosynthesis